MGVVNLSALVAPVVAGSTVTCRPVGNSMRPIVCSGQEVVIAPVCADRVEVDDVVLVRVAGHVYLHRVIAVDALRRRARIGNNHGRVNGWAPFDRIYGICVAVDGRPRPNIAGKISQDPRS